MVICNISQHAIFHAHILFKKEQARNNILRIFLRLQNFGIHSSYLFSVKFKKSSSENFEYCFKYYFQKGIFSIPETLLTKLRKNEVCFSTLTTSVPHHIETSLLIFAMQVN